MSFFLKGKQTNRPNARTKYSKGVKRKLKKHPVVKDDKEDEIDSEAEENVVSDGETFSSEDERETPQDKKLRLAKVYLEEIQKEERARLGVEEVSRDVISKRLKDDYLKQTGKLRLSVADRHKGFDEDNVAVLKCKEHYTAITCVCVASQDGIIFSGSKNGSIVKWSLTGKTKLGSIPYVKKHPVSTSTKILGHGKEILSMALSSDDKYLAVGDGSNDIQVWNAKDLKHVGTLKGHRGSVTGLVFRNDTHTLYSGSKDKSVKVWSVSELSYVETLYGHQDGVTAIDALAKERAITCGGSDTSIRIWKIPEESQLLYNGHIGSVDAVRFINGDNFVSGGDDGQICVWSILKKKPLCQVNQAHGYDLNNSHPFWITSIAPLVNTDLIASGSYDGVIRLWKMEHRSLSQIHEIHLEGFINDLRFSPDGKYLVAGVGREHKRGRWTVIKTAKNSVVIIPLLTS